MKYLNKYQKVVFTDIDGTTFTEGYLECRGYSEKYQGFYSFSKVDGSRLISNEIVERKPKKSAKAKKPTSTKGMRIINPCGETEKAYKVCVGTNGLVGKGQKAYYEYVAKSICYVENGVIYAPMWACRW